MTTSPEGEVKLWLLEGEHSSKEWKNIGSPSNHSLSLRIYPVKISGTK
jgi:hypothetical protein